MQRCRLALVVACCLFFLFFSASQFFLIPRLTKFVGEDLQKNFQAEQVQVQVRSPWGWEVFLGRIPKLDLVLKRAVLEDLVVEEMKITGSQIRFDPRLLWVEREFVYDGAEDLQADLLVLEKDLNEYFWSKVDPARSMSLTLRPEGVNLEGAVDLWNIPLNLKLTGILEVWQNSSVRFVPQNLEGRETRVPPLFLEVINEHYNFGFNFAVFPCPLTISQLRTEEGQVLIRIGVVP